MVSARLHRCVIGVQRGLQQTSEADLGLIAARSRYEKDQRNRATFCWKPRTIIVCFPGLDGTLPSALFCERQFSSYPDYCQMELRWQAAMPHVVQVNSCHSDTEVAGPRTTSDCPNCRNSMRRYVPQEDR